MSAEKGEGGGTYQRYQNQRGLQGALPMLFKGKHGCLQLDRFGLRTYAYIHATFDRDSQKN